MKKILLYCLLLTGMASAGQLQAQCNAAFAWDQEGNSLEVHFDDQSTSEQDIVSWHWNFGDGHQSDAQNPVHVFEEYGTFLVCLVIETGMGCVDDICHEVHIEGPPDGCNAAFIWEQYANSYAVDFADQSTSEHDIVSYLWNFGDGHMSDNENPTHTFAEPGVYVVCLTIESETGCEDDICHEVHVEEVAGDCEAAFEWFNGNDNLQIQFHDLSDDDPDIISWHWNFGDGQASEQQNPLHTYDEPGWYLVCLVVENEFGCINDICHEVQVLDQNGDCEAAFEWEATGLTIHFIDNSDDDPDIVSWLWTFGDGHMSDDANPTHTYAEPGVYVVCLTVINEFDCVDDICHEVHVEANNDDCEAAFEWESNGLVVHFIDNSDDDPDIVSWHWIFGDGHTSDDANATHTYAEPGVYTVCLLVINEFGCASDICHQVTVEANNDDCEAAFEWEGSGLVIHFFDNSDDNPDIVSWLWTFGDGHMSDDANPTHTYEEPGNYLVCLTVTNEFGCVDDICHEVFVEGNYVCEADFEWFNGNGDLEIQFHDLSDDDPDIVSWVWHFGDGHSGDGQNPTHTYDSAGVYTVCLIVTNEFGCVSDVCHEVHVGEASGECEAAFEWEGNGLVIHFIDHSDDDPDIISYHWSFGDGHFGDGANPVHTYGEPGVYVVCLTVTNEFGCMDEVCHEVHVGNDDGCEADFEWFSANGDLEIQFHDLSDDDPDIVSWIWHFGDGHTGDGQNPTHTYDSTGVYVVCLVVTNEFGCVSDVCHEVHVGEAHGECEAAFEWEGNGLVIHFIDQSDDDPDIISYHWNFGDGHFGDGANPNHTYDTAGVYVVCLTVTNAFGCVDEVCHEVHVGGSNDDCEAAFEWENDGPTVHFIDQSDDDPDIISWHWNFGDGHSSTEQNPHHTYEEPGGYLVCLVVENEFGCISDICHEVHVTQGIILPLYNNSDYYTALYFTPESAHQATASQGFRINYLPNPVATDLIFDYVIFTPSSLRYEVFDLTGENRLSGRIEAAEPGTYRYSVDVSDLQPGIYMLRLESEGRVVTKTIVLAQ